EPSETRKAPPAEGRDGRRVDAPAEEDTHRHIGHQLIADDSGKELGQSAFGSLGVGRLRRDVGNVPITTKAQPFLIHCQDLAWLHLPNTREEGSVKEGGVEVQVLVDCLLVYFSGDGG